MKKYFGFLLICLILLTTTLTKGMDFNNNLMGKVIVLDAGHGGKDKGSNVNGIYESDINLEIVLALRDELTKQGVEVILTRDGDFDLSSPNVSRRKKSDFDNRINLINNSNADMYLSIHMNYLEDNRYYGAQVFYTDGNERIADCLQKQFSKDLKSPMKIKKLQNTIYMYQRLEIPGVLIECGFLSNKNERYLLKDSEYQSKVVDSIIKGLIEYY